jgi:hypothetical protein
MVVGTCIIELHLPENHSLKEKRQVIKRLKDRLRNNFNVSVAETDHQELWQRASLGIAYVCNDRQRADQALNQMLNFVERQNLAVIINYDMEITTY